MYTEVMQVIKAVIFDMYETLITLFDSPLYFGTQMASDAGIAEERFQETWRAEEKNRTKGKITLEELLEKIIPMLRALKKEGIMIGLISNCFSEESMVIKKSILYPFFDAVCLSFDEGIQKPDPAIFERCIERLGVEADACLYVGDGGSNELEAAQRLGMQVVQAVWYLKEGINQPAQRKTDFEHIEKPMDIIELIKKQCLV